MMRPRPPSSRTKSVKLVPGCALLDSVFLDPLLLQSPTVGVGMRPLSCRTASDNGIPPCAYFLVLSVAASSVGVGHNPRPLSEVRSSGLLRAVHAPLRIEPHRGQIPENSVEPPSIEHCGVLHEDVAWSHFANDAGHLEPEGTSVA